VGSNLRGNGNIDIVAWWRTLKRLLAEWPLQGGAGLFMAEPSNWIAIVDDNSSVLTALARLLRVRGLQAGTYNSAREFLASLRDGLPECLIVDFQMPGMTGLQLHEYLTRIGIQIPTIIMTGQPDMTIREQCEAAGAVAFLSKPLGAALLFTAIDDARKISADKN
jgi:FixJ family two-component response regulator